MRKVKVKTTIGLENLKEFDFLYFHQFMNTCIQGEDEIVALVEVPITSISKLAGRVFKVPCDCICFIETPE